MVIISAVGLALLKLQPLIIIINSVIISKTKVVKATNTLLAFWNRERLLQVHSKFCTMGREVSSMCLPLEKGQQLDL